MQSYKAVGQVPDLEKTANEDGSILYRYQNETGDILMRDYTVFPGIHVAFNDVHMNGCDMNVSASPAVENILEIDHCKEGRIECLRGNDYVYLSDGDLAVHQKLLTKHETMFPTGHYHGITISIDTTEAPKSLASVLEEVNVSPDRLMNKFCKNGTSFVARANEKLNHIFAELYDLPERIKLGYLKIKVLEILLFLSALPVADSVQKQSFSTAQVGTAKEACRILLSNLDRHITIEELAERLHVSPTQLKNSFKGVYGEPIFSFVRRQKMLGAASMLRSTDKTVLEIAGLFGYSNGGKFATAFCDEMGMMPAKYRRQN